MLMVSPPRLVRLSVVRPIALGALIFGLLFVLAPRLAAAQVAYEQQVQQMYIAYYGRPGDPSGVSYWAGELAAVGGNWIAELIDAFGNSSEYTSRFGGLDDATLINNLFLGLFNRSADSEGLAYYVDLLNGSNVSGYNPEMRQSTLAQLALDIANGTQSGTADAATLNNKLSVAAVFTAAVRSTGSSYGSAEIPAAVDLIAAVNAQPESVTEAQDTIDEMTGGASVAHPVNDTGIDWCAHDASNSLICPVTSYPGQDGDSGRDVTASDDSDGRAGFSFTKLDSNGNDLPASATAWSCVRDNVTGKIWEVKTDDGGLRDRNWTYSWYDSSSPNAEPASEYIGRCFANGRLCNTENFVDDVNAEGLCGFTDWRLPTPQELTGIVDYGRHIDPAIDIDYFGNTKTARYWSSLSRADAPHRAWYVDFGNGGYASSTSTSSSSESVRLVRGEQPPRSFVDNGDGTVTDPDTGLLWTKCIIGRSGSHCIDGYGETMDWQQALAFAETATLGGYSDWRLPTIKELHSLVDYSLDDPAIDEQFFSATPGREFWSSSPDVSDSSDAWAVSFSSGVVGTGGKRINMSVRLVRDLR